MSIGLSKIFSAVADNLTLRNTTAFTGGVLSVVSGAQSFGEGVLAAQNAFDYIQHRKHVLSAPAPRPPFHISSADE